MTFDWYLTGLMQGTHDNQCLLNGKSKPYQIAKYRFLTSLPESVFIQVTFISVYSIYAMYLDLLWLEGIWFKALPHIF